ncbi:mechanosensitive ion channel family protein [Hydrocarboniphaga sp.]|uniref:mechanosensitive ion channel family protein n=1 Tax=Hydrocarboniphaga sp. TaxID=2033016 RepID=UPI003D100D78
MATTAAALEARENSELSRILHQFDIPESLQVWLEPAIRLMLVLVIWYLLHKLVGLLVRRLEKRLLDTTDLTTESQFDARKRVGTLISLLKQVINIFLFVLLALVLLTQLGVQVGPLIAGAGIIGVAVGFGAQYLVRDIITGFFMVLENQIRVGDVVTINGTGGLVEVLSLRTIVLRDGTGTVHVFPHGSVTTLSNSTRDWSAYIFNVQIAYKEDPAAAITAIREVFAELGRDELIGAKMIADVEIWGVDKLDGSAATIQGRIKTRPGQQADVGRAFLRRLREVLTERGIDMPTTAPAVQIINPTLQQLEAPKP